MKKLKAKIFYMAAISVAKHCTASDDLVKEAKKLAKEKRIVFSDLPEEGYSCHAICSVPVNWKKLKDIRSSFMNSAKALMANSVVS